MTKTCYMCPSTATTKEHVPAKCFFPEKKDVTDGTDYRKQLITVPSCPEHNTQTSEDDEYALVVIVGFLENNRVGQRQARTKVLRALTKSDGLYAVSVAEMRLGCLAGTLGVTFKPKLSRVDAVFQKIACAMYFHHFKHPAPHQPVQWSSSLRSANKLGNQWANNVAAGIESVISGEPKQGHNPDAFFYQVHQPVQNGPVLMRFVFYEGFQFSMAFPDASGNLRTGQRRSDNPTTP